MSLGRKEKTEGGSGGKRGHSNMTHWNKTEYIKEVSKKKRRIESKKLSSDAEISPPLPKEDIFNRFVEGWQG